MCLQDSVGMLHFIGMLSVSSLLRSRDSRLVANVLYWSLALKGPGHQMNTVIILKALLVFKLLGCLVEEKINIKILIASTKTLTNLKTGPEAA